MSTYLRSFVISLVIGLCCITWLTLYAVPHASVISLLSPQIEPYVVQQKSQQQQQQLVKQETVLRKRRKTIERYCASRNLSQPQSLSAQSSTSTSPSLAPPSSRQAPPTTTTTYYVDARLRRYFSFSDRHRLVYCSIQKVASSFWLRVMKVLTGQVKREKIFNESMTHSTGMRGFYSFTTKTDQQVDTMLRTYAKFLFVRDPYARLFSAYMDKVFLPTRRQFQMATRVRALQERAGETGEPGSVSQVDQQKRLANVTFRQFLEVVIRGLYQDPHWTPMHKHCAPCTVHYHYVGKLETLTADADVILTAAGVKVSELTPGEESLSASSELTALTDLVGKFFVGGNAKTGSSDTYRCQVVNRIWITLQTRGLLSRHLPYPFPTHSNCSRLTKSQLLQTFILAFRRSGSRPRRMRQRGEAMMEAYLRLPRPVLKRVEGYVRDDCLMFGYECSVDVRFPVTQLPLLKYSYFDSFL